MGKLIKGINDLETWCKNNDRLDILEQWSTEKNKGLNPSDISSGSHEKVWWKMKYDDSFTGKEFFFEWYQEIRSRTQKNCGCPYLNNTLYTGFNDLETRFPLIAKEWDYVKNGDMAPSQIHYGSKLKVWWKDSYGHEWYQSISNRTFSGQGCPICGQLKATKNKNKSMVKRKGSLIELLPDIADEWNYTRNEDLSPSDVTVGSSKKVWWKCKNGHEWNESINARTKKGERGCPYCAGARIVTGINDLETWCRSNGRNELIEQWSEKNSKKMMEYSPYSNKKVFWKQNYTDLITGKTYVFEWESIIYDRVHKKCGCPYLNGKFYRGFNDLESLFPDIAKEWDYEKNGSLTPSDVTSKKDLSVWWKCSCCGNRWQARINNRTAKQSGCPECSKKKRAITQTNTTIKARGSLQDNFPNLLAEWNFERNGNLLPSMVTSRSSKRVWWKCKNGHEWITPISGRTDDNPTGCPECNRTGTSFPEQAIYFYLKQIFADAINTDKHIGVELDIFIPSRNIAIEYDGEAWHSQKTERDIEKNEICKNNGIDLVRIREPELVDIEGCKVFIRYDNKSSDSLNKVITDLLIYLGVSESAIDVDIDRDTISILEQYRFKEYNNSLAVCYPLIAKEWHSEKNGKIKPENVASRSHKKVWWKCSKGHEWQARISVRTDFRRNATGSCPICSGAIILSGYNDLETWCKENGRNELIDQWDHIKNSKPMNECSPFSNRKVWWHLPYDDGNTGKHFDFEWQAPIYNRTSLNSGCPFLYNSVWTGFNDLQTLCPDIAKEWDYEKNGEILPSKVSQSSNKKVWWKCKNGHEWQAIVQNRTENNSQCPYCSVRKVKNLDTDETFDSIQEAASKYKLKVCTIRNCCLGHNNTAGGFHWKYLN